MPAVLYCQRTPADQVDYEHERFIACKWIGVVAGGRKFEMGDEIPPGTLDARAMREIYDTPTRLVETMDYALADPELLEAMMRRAPALDPDEEDDEPDGDDGDIVTSVSSAPDPPAASEARRPAPRAGSAHGARRR